MMHAVNENHPNAHMFYTLINCTSDTFRFDTDFFRLLQQRIHSRKVLQLTNKAYDASLSLPEMTATTLC